MRLHPRWLGLAASCLVALSGFLAGKPGPSDAAWWTGTVLWFVALGLLGLAWWRLRDETDTRALLVTAVLWCLPLLIAPPLGALDVYAYGCQGQLFNAGFDLYRSGPSALPCTWLSAVPPLWRDTPTPYGPLWFAISGGVAWLAHGSLLVAVGLFRAVAIGGLVLCVVAAHRLSGRRNAALAASPLVLVHVVSGVHNDILMAGFVLAGFAFAARGGLRLEKLSYPAASVKAQLNSVSLLAGVAFGLAAAIKITALVAVPFAALLLLRPARQVFVFAGGLVGTYAALALATGHGLGFVKALGSTAGLVQWLSLPTGLGMAVGYVLRAAGEPDAFGATVAVFRVLGLVALAAVLAGLWWWAARERTAERVLTAAGLGLLATAWLGPVFYAWYALAGIAVLAATDLTGRLRTGVQVAAVGLPFLTLPDSLGIAVKTKLPGAFLDVALVIWLAVRLRSARRHRTRS